MALELLRDCHRAYKDSSPDLRRIANAAFFERIYLTEEGEPTPVPTGTPLAAPADGVILLATDRPYTIEGNMVMIAHGMGLVSTFLHLSRIDVKDGDTVRRGQILGATGATGRATGPHMHWGMRWNDERIALPVATNDGRTVPLAVTNALVIREIGAPPRIAGEAADYIVVA